MSDRDGTPTDESRRPGALATTREPVRLTAPQQRVLRRVLDAGEELRADLEAKLRSFGRLVLEEVFDSDSGEAAATTETSSANPIMQEVLRRAGGPTLRVNAKVVSVTVRIVAWEKAITDEAFLGLDWDRKALLLPLGDADAIREAAQHISAFKLDDDAAAAYVDSLRTKTGRAPVPRLTPGRAKKQLTDLRKRLADRRALPRLIDACASLEPAERAEIVSEIERLVDVLGQLRQGLRRR